MKKIKFLIPAFLCLLFVSCKKESINLDYLPGKWLEVPKDPDAVVQYFFYMDFVDGKNVTLTLIEGLSGALKEEIKTTYTANGASLHIKNYSSCQIKFLSNDNMTLYLEKTSEEKYFKKYKEAEKGEKVKKP